MSLTTVLVFVGYRDSPNKAPLIRAVVKRFWMNLKPLYFAWSLATLPLNHMDLIIPAGAHHIPIFCSASGSISGELI